MSIQLYCGQVVLCYYCQCNELLLIPITKIISTEDGNYKLIKYFYITQRQFHILFSSFLKPLTFALNMITKHAEDVTY